MTTPRLSARSRRWRVPRWGALLAAHALLAPAPAVAQVPADTSRARADTLAVPDDASADLEAILEDDAAGDPTELVELLAALAEAPLDVNTATAPEMTQFPALDALTASAIVRYR